MSEHVHRFDPVCACGHKFVAPEIPAPRARPSIFDEFRGLVVDLPVGTILPGWVSKSAVILAIDELESEWSLRAETGA